MKIMGYKFLGQDSAVFYLDTDSREVFALSAERVSRIKKDNYDISPILDVYADRFRAATVAACSFGTYDGNDAVLETKGTSYYWLNYQRLYRAITRPKSRFDLERRRSFLEGAWVFLRSVLSPRLYYFKLMRDYYWKRYINDSLPRGFHKDRIDRSIKETLDRYGIGTDDVRYYDHHLCHAAAAYYMSPVGAKGRAVVLTLDEHGDECFSKLYMFDGQEHEEISRSNSRRFWLDDQVYMTSIAGLYSSFTQAIGLRRSCDEGKVEALAAYGVVHKETYEQLRNIVRVKDLSFDMDVEAFKQFSEIPYLQAIRSRIGEKNFCATIQAWLEDVVVDYLNEVHERFGVDTLCLAGGCVANVIMNYKIYEKTPFKHLHVLPSMGDEGSAAGAAIMVALEGGEDLSWMRDYKMPYFGPSFQKPAVQEALQSRHGIRYEVLGDIWPELAAQSISEGRIICVFHGRMEFGPRALGNRSILANCTAKDMRDRINANIKRRPWYQPLCPSVLEEERERLFENSFQHKHMATAFRVREAFHSKLPSAIHVDGTARPQFVEEDDNPSIYRLLKEVKRLTGYGIVINTSFNLHGRTIVHTPEDAITDFLDCNLDELYIEGYKVTKVGLPLKTESDDVQHAIDELRTAAVDIANSQS